MTKLYVAIFTLFHSLLAQSKRHTIIYLISHWQSYSHQTKIVEQSMQPSSDPNS